MATLTKTTKRKTAASSKRNPSVNSIENGIKILELAIKKSISVSRAAKQKGFGRNYVSDIRARVSENYKSGNINRTQHSMFVKLYKQYEKSSKI